MLCVNSRHARSQIGRDVFEMNLWDKPCTRQTTANESHVYSLGFRTMEMDVKRKDIDGNCQQIFQYR